MTDYAANAIKIITAAKARRAAAGLVAADGVHCPTPEMKAWHDARHGLSRVDFDAKRDFYTKLRRDALASIRR